MASSDPSHRGAGDPSPSNVDTEGVAWLPVPDELEGEDHVSKAVYMALTEVGPARAHRLGEVLQVPDGTMYHTLDRLESVGLVESRPGFANGGHVWRSVHGDPFNVEIDSLLGGGSDD